MSSTLVMNEFESRFLLPMEEKILFEFSYLSMIQAFIFQLRRQDGTDE